MMKRVISAGDRVKVDHTVKSYNRGSYSATVIGWTTTGRIKVKADKTGIVRSVSPENVKKISDTKPTE